jgi:hypothetical protein
MGASHPSRPVLGDAAFRASDSESLSGGFLESGEH